MSCSSEKFTKCSAAKECECYQAVMRTYKSLTQDMTIPDTIAIDAAQRVYAFHFPDQDAADAGLTVEQWINHDHLQ